MPPTPSRRWISTAAVLAACAAVPCAAHAQDALATGIYARAGFVVTSLNAQSMSFAPQHARMATPVDGKYFGWNGQMQQLGVSLGLTVDARWFYVRAGADIYQNPDLLANAASFDSRFTTLAWVAAGPRFRVGPVVLSAGVRFGALLMNVTETAASMHPGREWSAVDGVYALDAGIQWRPLRWFEVDASIGHDFFGPTASTTGCLAANFGWSR